MGSRPPSVALLAAAVAAAWVGAAMAKQPAEKNYPYAGVCPAAGIRDDVDRWRMNTCNCTSFVAWELAAHGYRTDWFIAGAMDAWNWPHVARLAHLTVDHTPRVGSIAVWPRWGRLGHLAFVTGIHDDGTFDVAEYNRPGRRPRFGFDLRHDISPRGVRFIHVLRRTGRAVR